MSLTKVTYSMIDGAAVNVRDFGAVGDGVANDTAAIQTAMDSFGGTGGVVYFPKGTYRIESSLTIPEYVTLAGAGRRVSVIKKFFNGSMASSIGGYASLQNISFDGNGATYTGRGIVVSSSGTPSIIFDNTDIENCEQQALLFSVADAGSTFRATNCVFNTLQTPGVMAAVVIGATDTQATSRHFTDCESGGCTLYDFGGCNDLYVTGGYSNGLLFGNANGSKAFINNLRVGSAAGSIIVRGSNHHFSNVEFGAAVELNGTAHYLSSSCGVPSWNITNNSSGSLFSTDKVQFATVWSQASGTQPIIGNGTLEMYYSRSGSLVTVFFVLTMGSTTTYGNSASPWLFSLPYRISLTTQKSNATLLDASSLATPYLVLAEFNAGETTVQFANAGQAIRDGFPLTWAVGDQIIGTFSYDAF